MFVSGRSPEGKPIHVPKGLREKKLQFALLQYYDKRNRRILEPFLREQGYEHLLRQIRYIQDRSGSRRGKKEQNRAFE